MFFFKVPVTYIVMNEYFSGKRNSDCRFLIYGNVFMELQPRRTTVALSTESWKVVFRLGIFGAVFFKLKFLVVVTCADTAHIYLLFSA